MENAKLISKSFLLIYCAGCLLIGCVSNYVTWSANANIKKIALGMSKDQVVTILGKDYLIASSSKNDYGKPVEVLAYKSDINEEYRLKFVNDQLTEWNREFINKYITKHPSP